MATERANDLRAFKKFIEEQLANGGSEMTLEEALANWEIDNQTDEEVEETLQAVREGLADVGAGRVRDAREAVAEIRRKFGFSELP